MQRYEKKNPVLLLLLRPSLDAPPNFIFLATKKRWIRTVIPCTLPFATQLMDSLQCSRIPNSSFHQLRVRADNLFSTSGRSQQGRGWAIILIIRPTIPGNQQQATIFTAFSSYLITTFNSNSKYMKTISLITFFRHSIILFDFHFKY